MKRIFLSILLALLLIAGGCGGSSDSSSDTVGGSDTTANNSDTATNTGNECANLSKCCSELDNSGGAQGACNQIVASNQSAGCGQTLKSYQQSKLCSGGTNTGGKTFCDKVNECCKLLPSGTGCEQLSVGGETVCKTAWEPPNGYSTDDRCKHIQ